MQVKVPAHWWKTLTLSGLFAGAQKFAESHAVAGQGGDVGALMITGGAVAAGLVGSYLVNRASSQAEAEEDAAQRDLLRQRNHHLRRAMAVALRRALKHTQAEARHLPPDPYHALFAHWETQLAQVETGNAEDDAAIEYFFPAEHAEANWGASNSYSPNVEEDARALAGVLRECLTPQILYLVWTESEARAFAQRVLPHYQQAFAEIVVAESGVGHPFAAFVVKGVSESVALDREILKIVRELRDRGAAANPPPPSKIWNVRRQRNPHLTGRDAFRRELREKLEAQHGAVLTQAIAGLGGVGKTTLATDYAYEFSADYEVVWEVPAEDTVSARGALAELAVRLGVEPNTNNPQAWESARTWLESHGRWLLLFDNAVSYDAIADLLPRSGNRGHILITSRNPNWRKLGVEPVSLPPLSPSDGASFLLRRSGRPANEEPDARAVSVDLGGLPLALDLAAAYVEENAVPFARYRARLAAAPLRLLDPVAKTWEISLEKLPEPAVRLLERLAFLAPDAIPRSLLEGFAEAAELDEAIGALRRHSLVTVAEPPGDGSLAVHRLLQQVVRSRIGGSRDAEVCGAVLRHVNGRFGYDPERIETWEPSDPLYEHAVAVAVHAADRGLEPDQTSDLLHQTGVLALNRRADLPAALGLLQRALVINEKSYGPDHPNVSILANNIGIILQAQSDLAGALTYARRALAIDEKTYGPDHPEVAAAANNIGAILQAQGDLAGALAYARRALAIDEKTHGPDHPEVAIDANNIGQILLDQGDLVGALAHAHRALAIDEKSYGPDHPNVARDANNIGRILQTQGDLAGALTYTRRALAIDEKSYGPDHPSVATCANNIGLILHAQGDLAGALTYACRALAIDEESYGPDHPDVARDANNIGQILQDQGDLVGALTYARRAVTVLAKSLGPDHHKTRAAASNLAIMERELQGSSNK